jgi:hypothetical protein
MSSTNFEQQHLSSFLSYPSYPFVRPPAEPILSSRPAPSWPAGRRVGQGWPSPSRSSTRSHFQAHSLMDPRARRQARPRRDRRRCNPLGIRQQQARQDDLRRACQVANTAHHVFVFGRSPLRGLNHGAVMRVGGEAPRRQAHSLDRHWSHGGLTGHCHLGSCWRCISLESGDQLSSLSCFHRSLFMSPDAGRRQNVGQSRLPVPNGRLLALQRTRYGGIIVTAGCHDGNIRSVVPGAIDGCTGW